MVRVCCCCLLLLHVRAQALRFPFKAPCTLASWPPKALLVSLMVGAWGGGGCFVLIMIPMLLLPLLLGASSACNGHSQQHP